MALFLRCSVALLSGHRGSQIRAQLMDFKQYFGHFGSAFPLKMEAFRDFQRFQIEAKKTQFQGISIEFDNLLVSWRFRFSHVSSGAPLITRHDHVSTSLVMVRDKFKKRTPVHNQRAIAPRNFRAQINNLADEEISADSGLDLELRL